MLEEYCVWDINPHFKLNIQSKEYEHEVKTPLLYDFEKDQNFGNFKDMNFYKNNSPTLHNDEEEKEQIMGTSLSINSDSDSNNDFNGFSNNDFRLRKDVIYKKIVRSFK